MRLVERLVGGTAGLQAEIDRDLVAQLITSRRYEHYLERMYGFVAPLERSIATTPDVARFVDMRRFNKEELLRRDLYALRSSRRMVDGLAQCSVPLFDTAAQAIGWAFVIEHSTLAYGALFRAVASAIPGHVAFASSYLKCYSGSVGEMWREFARSLDQLDEEGQGDAVIGAAFAAYRAYERLSRSTQQTKEFCDEGANERGEAKVPERDRRAGDPQ